MSTHLLDSGAWALVAGTKDLTKDMATLPPAEKEPSRMSGHPESRTPSTTRSIRIARAALQQLRKRVHRSFATRASSDANANESGGEEEGRYGQEER